MMCFRNFGNSFSKGFLGRGAKPLINSRPKFFRSFSNSPNGKFFSSFKNPSFKSIDSFLKNLKYPLYIYLIGANALVYLLWKAPMISRYFMMKNFTFSSENLSKGRFHTIVTHAFSHFNFMHLGFNMMTLYFFGSFIEKSFGSKLLLQLYLAGAIVGALFSQTQNYQSRIPLHHLGASSANASILTYFIMCFPQHTIYLLIFPVPAWMVGLFLFSQSLLFFNSGSGVSFSGHLGGIAAGATMFVLKRRIF
jgi:membrane associated rhomboid family serine protease